MIIRACQDRFSRTFFTLLFFWCLPLSLSAQQGFCFPLKHFKLNSPFGFRIHPMTQRLDFHKGVDLFARNESVYAIADGVVSASGFNSILGNFIKIRHGELESIYGHLKRCFLNAGEEVKCGDSIGLSGKSGRVTGEHLHFSLRYKAQYIDPIGFFHQLYAAPSAY